MARIRSIKPDFWTSEQVMECSTNVRLLFIGLWNFCDDTGRHPVAPKKLKALIFPADDFSVEDVSRMLDELSTNGLIQYYTVDNKEFFQVTGWHHQKIDRPQKAKYPAPISEHSSNGSDGEEGKGRERKGEEEGGRENAQTDFAFVGRTIRLKADDFARWRKAYSAIPDFIAELTKADDFYSESPPADGKWFFPVSRWLEKAHREASKPVVDPDEEIYRNVL